MKPFCEKYKPENLKEVFFDDETLRKLKLFVLENKPVIISGATGVGKSCLVYALAKELNYEVIEFNASDTRNKSNVEEILKPAIKEGSLFGKGKIVLIDDVDAVSGTYDRGAIPGIISLLSESKNSIIMTTSDLHNNKISTLRKKCGIIDIGQPTLKQILSVLKTICEKEKIEYDDSVLKEIAISSRGDLRAAINDLQVLSSKGVVIFDELHKREKKEDIFYALNIIFREKNKNEVLNCFERANIELDEAVLWLDENIPRVYLDKLSLAKAYESLSKADVFNGRIIRRQYWRFLVYRNFFLSNGVMIAGVSNSEITFKRSGRLLKLFWAKQKNLKKKEIAAKIGKKMHCSRKKVLLDVLPYIVNIYKNGESFDEIKFNDEEIEWLRR